MSYTINIDGSCGPINPGGTAGWGMVVKQDGVKVYENGGEVGRGEKMSNNVAEWYAFGRALDWFEEHGETGTILTDSQLVVHQASGRWRIKRGLYKDYALEAVLKYRSMKRRPVVKWIPREQNEEADFLAEVEEVELEDLCEICNETRPLIGGICSRCR